MKEKQTVSNTVFNEVRPLLEGLLSTLSDDRRYDGVSILAENSTGRTYRVSKSGTVIKDNPFSNTGAVLRISCKGEPFEYSFNIFSKEFLESVPAVIENHFNLSPDTAKEEDGSQTPLNACEKEPASRQTCFNRSSEYLTDPVAIPDSEITDRLMGIHREACDKEHIIDCICVFQYLKIHKMFLSEEKDFEQHLMWSTGVIQPLSSKDDKTHYYYQTFSALGGAEILDDMKNGLDSACEKAVILLDSTPVTPGFYEVICMPDVTGLIAHEAFGHGVEMDMFVKDRALAKDYVGKQVASPLVTMHDNAATCLQAATYFFDDEGTLSHDTVIIRDGILVSGINDLESARILGVTPTGNGRRESFERKAYTRMTNTYFEAGTSSLEEMIASVSYGILLENGASGMEDPKNWGIQCMVNMGWEIKDGKLTGKVFSPLCLSGFVPDLLKSISMVSSDLKLSGSGFCGKGHKEWVKVSDGGAAIKTCVHLS